MIFDIEFIALLAALCVDISRYKKIQLLFRVILASRF